MKCYIKKDQVSESIEYFKNAGFDTDDMLFLFLMAKHMGVSASYPVTFLNSALTVEQKMEELNCLVVYLILEKCVAQKELCFQLPLESWPFINQELNLIKFPEE